MSATVTTQANRPMAVKTPLATDLLLLEGFTGYEGISQPFSFQLDVLAENQRLAQLPNRAIAFEDLLGKKNWVRFDLPGGGVRFFHGICARFTETGRDDFYTAYRMELVPLFWLFSRRAQSRIFQRMTVKAILKKVFENLGLADGADFKFELDETGGLGHPRDYCVQYRETDFNFACRLMEEEGIYYYFKHSENAHQMIVGNTANHPEIPGASELPYNEDRHHELYQAWIHDWNKTQAIRSGAYRLQDQCFELTSAKKPPFFQDLSDPETIQDCVHVGKVCHKLSLAIEKIGTNKNLEIYDFPGEYAQRFDGVNVSGGDQSNDLKIIFKDNKRTTILRMQEEALGSLVVQGSGNCRQFASGHRFKVKGHYNADGPYVLTSVTHNAGDLSYRSNQGGGFSYRNQFSCIPVGLQFRPSRTTAKPVVLGTQTAVVVGSGAKGEEFLVDKYGRVKVQFHWDRAGPHNADPDQGKYKYSSCWVRVSQPWAGKNWGAFFWPRIGQEVVVAFLEGDPDQPIIVGSVYNADQMPPYLGDAANPSPDPKHKNDPKLSGIKTNTTPGGVGFNELRFDDTKDKQQVFIHAERDLDSRTKNECRELVLNNRHLIIGAEKDGQKQGDQRELVIKDKHLTIQGNHTEQIQGDMQLLVGGGDDGGNQDVFIKKTKKERIDEDCHLHVKGNRNEQVEGTRSLVIGGDRQEKVGSNLGLEVGQAIHIKSGMTLVLEAGMQLTLKVGSNFIDLGPAGVTIVGSLVTINSGGVAGSGSGAHPASPEDAREASPMKPDVADDAKTGAKSAP